MEPNESRTLTQDGLVAELREQGCADLTTRRVAHWRTNDLLPPFDLVGSGRGRRRGRERSAWTHGEDVLNQAKQVYELLKTQGTFSDCYLPLWILGFPVPLRRIREGLRKPLETTSNDVALEVDGRNAIEDLIDDAAYEFTGGLRRANMELFDVPQDTLAALMNVLLNTDYDLEDQPFQDGVEALRGWEQKFQARFLQLLGDDLKTNQPGQTSVDSGLTVFTHAPFVNKYLSVPRLKEVVEKCTDDELLAVSGDLQVGREIVLEFWRLLKLFVPFLPDEMKPTRAEALSTIFSVGKIFVWADLSLRLNGYGEVIERILRLMLDEIRNQFDENLERELCEAGPQVTNVMETLIEQLGHSVAHPVSAS